MKSDGIYIALGANLPSAGRTPRQTIDAALAALDGEGVSVLARSSHWHSPAWPDPADPPYVNAAAAVETALDARGLLDLLHKVEDGFGRQRRERWASRPLDLDLLDFRGRCERTGGLEIPHPRAAGRAFVLLPLQEIAPHWHDPVSGRPVGDLLAALPQADRDAMYVL